MGFPKVRREEASPQVQLGHPTREAEALEVDETWRATPVPTRSEALPLPADPEPSHTENLD